MNDQPDQDQSNTASGTITGVDSEGNVTSSEFVLDPATGQSVVMGDELSDNAREFMSILGMVGDLMTVDDEKEEDA